MQQAIQLTSAILEYLGTIMIALTALLVHKRVRKEHKIDKRVLSQIQTEESFAYLGIILVTIGFILNLLP